jgi:hypothetical protein
MNTNKDIVFMAVEQIFVRPCLEYEELKSFIALEI